VVKMQTSRNHLVNGRASSPLPAAHRNCGAHGVTRPTSAVHETTSNQP
jgi:hypothetical protein